MEEYYPEYVVWETTLACNLACLHCGSRAGTARPDELSTDEALDLVDQLAALGTKEITFSGGEFLLRSDWSALIDRSRERGMRNLVISNGFAITRAVAAELARLAVASVSISLDGGEAVHDRLRPSSAGATSFGRIMEAFGHLRDAGITVAVVTQVSQANLEELEMIRQILTDQGIRYWQIQLTNPMGRGAEGSAVRVLEPAEAGTVARFIRTVQDAGVIQCLAADNVGYFAADEHVLRSGGRRGDRFWTGCQAGLRVLGITSDGGVKGCLSMPDSFREGNVRERSLAAIWNDAKAFAYNRRFSVTDLTGACRECAFAKLCRAGCHSFTAATTGAISENPYCIRNIDHA